MNNKNTNSIGFTGERMINHTESLMFKIAFEGYEFANKYVKNKNVLDFACGSGYGSDLLSRNAAKVLGADIDFETIEYCKTKYKRDNLSFICVEQNKEISEFKDAFDVIVSLQTIEHITEYKVFLFSLKRYLKKNGIVIIATPNNFRNVNPPANEFHIYEFDIIELYNILKGIFVGYQVAVYGQCKTGVKRSDKIDEKRFSVKRLITDVVVGVYNFDRKHLNICHKIEHLKIYKYFSNLQNEYKGDISIYPINPDEKFFNPSTSYYVIQEIPGVDSVKK